MEEFERFKAEPTVETAIAFGKAITLKGGDLKERNRIYNQAFGVVDPYSEVGAIVNLYQVASIMEVPQMHFTNKVMYLRDALKDGNLTPQIVEEWAWTVLEAGRIDHIMLDFLKSDVGSRMRGISTELRRALGHPCPENPFRDGGK